MVGLGRMGGNMAERLRRDGHEVTVIDRLPPGEACSFGNSGAMPRNHWWSRSLDNASMSTSLPEST